MKLTNIAAELKLLSITCEGIRDHGDRREETVSRQFDDLSSQLDALSKSLDKITSEQARRQGQLQATLEALQDIDSINL